MQPLAWVIILLTPDKSNISYRTSSSLLSLPATQDLWRICHCNFCYSNSCHFFTLMTERIMIVMNVFFLLCCSVIERKSLTLSKELPTSWLNQKLSKWLKYASKYIVNDIQSTKFLSSLKWKIKIKRKFRKRLTMKILFCSTFWSDRKYFHLVIYNMTLIDWPNDYFNMKSLRMKIHL